MTKSCKQVYWKFKSLGDTIKDDDVESRKKSKRMEKIEIGAENHSEYHPCDMNCPFKKANVPREKYCHCELDCPRRFPGCNRSGSGKTCSNRSCLFFSNYRECDPDLCKYAASEPLNTQFIAWANILEKSYHKQRLRPGRIYDKLGISFLFNLDKVDATRKGNKFRFINHSNDPNTYCLTLVNGEHRIRIYALGDFDPGQELFQAKPGIPKCPTSLSLHSNTFLPPRIIDLCQVIAI
ncbi:hypothetical protein Glove_63g56 [Diversispora epigaea]|uniref:CXC domain-containing protein n=1 Tax=Diversispora epigaea TaxID=1348612 RepID=A0A397JEQ5_9GLOM|nr:hypothetical protein Glove_63g56 [Diversispora epigaea]